MSRPQPFDPLTLPLQGMQLVEASAGTGKTFSLAALYLRLVVEQGAEIRDVLVMTFTRAATRELRERIRLRLARAAGLAAEPAGAEDNAEDRFALALLEQAMARGESSQQLVRRLREAAIRMDEAVISTIHAFAQQAAAENAFDSGLPFDRGEQIDDRVLLPEVVADYWRGQAIARPHARAVALTQLWADPAALEKDLRPALQQPHARLAGPPESEISGLHRQVLELWQSQRGKLEEWLEELTQPGGLLKDKGLYRYLQWCGDVSTLMANLEAGLQGTPAGHPALPGWLRDFTDEAGARKHIQARAVKAGLCPHELELVQALARLQPLGYLAALRAALDSVRGTLAQRKHARRQYSFADMIEALHGAITDADNGRTLAKALHRTWPWALVDEFQDTDPLQYRILREIYYGRRRGALIMIGDPKQAIFGFRGGDVFAYLQAARDADGCYGLDTNFRSTEGLLQAVESLFSAVPGESDGPFLIRGIDYHPVRAGRASGDKIIEQGGKPLPAMTAWVLEAADLNKKQACEQLQNATVAEIYRLLAGDDGAKLLSRDKGARRLRPADIAVLVNTNDEATEMQMALARHGIAAVCLHQASVFAGEQAQDLQLVLRAAAMPADGDAVRAAQVTALGGCHQGEMLALAGDEAAWQAVIGEYQSAHQRWRDSGILAMLEPLIQAASPRLLKLRDGERRLTNFLQLAELLAEAESECFGLEALIHWLDEQISESGDGGETGENRQLRLESDEALVRVSTVHRVKGLQYGVVFLPFTPFLGVRPAAGQPPRGFHDDKGRSWLDYAADAVDPEGARALTEACAESLRLLYVALTRAEQACYFAWGAVPGAQNSALAWLLHARDGADPSRVADARSKLPAWLNPETIRQRLNDCAARCPQALQMTAPPPALAAAQRLAPTPPPRGRAREDFPARRPAWSVFSFTRLVAGGSHVPPTAGADDEVPDNSLDAVGTDSLPAAREAAEVPLVPLRGAAFGTAVHDVLETTRLHTWPAPGESVPDPLRQIIARTLSDAGVALPEGGRQRAQLLTGVGELVARTLHTPLPEIGPLAALADEQQLAELEFHLGLGGPALGELVDLLAVHGYATRQMQARRQVVLRGLMHGFIDLVVEVDGRYWVLDYKTNDLGRLWADYAHAPLARAISEAHYDLQYLIYTVALHRHLQRHLGGYSPEQHLGGVQYLFVRGMNGRDADSGIYWHCPEADFVRALDELFRAGSGEHQT